MSIEPSLPPRWVRVASQLPIHLSWVVMVGAGLSVLSRGSSVGIALVIVGVLTAYLALRRSLAVVRGTVEAEYSGNLGSRQFDYIIWSLIGLPIVLGLLLVVLALSGNLS